VVLYPTGEWEIEFMDTFLENAEENDLPEVPRCLDKIDKPNYTYSPHADQRDVYLIELRTEALRC
jgi:hypothetical protein